MRYHLLDAVEALAVEAEGLFKQDSILHRPLIRKRGEVRKISQRFLNVVFVPEEHPQSLKGRKYTGYTGTDGNNTTYRIILVLTSVEFKYKTLPAPCCSHVSLWRWRCIRPLHQNNTSI